MEAVILAGGLGTRLRPCVDNLPKPLAPIDGKPFLRYLLDFLYVNGVNRAIISTGYLAEAIEEFIGKCHRGMIIEYCREDSPLGTGGAIKKALGMCKTEYPLVVNGDSFLDVDIAEMKKFHEKSECPITLAAKFVPSAENSGFVVTENGILRGFTEKGVASSGLINGGIYFVKKDLLNSINEEKFSFEKTVLESGFCKTAVYESKGYFIDIGIPENYRKAQEEKNFLSVQRKRKAVFLDRDGTLNRDTGHLYRKEDFEFLPDADKAVAEIKNKGYLAIVITNQAGIAKNLYTPSDVDSLHSFIDSKLLNNASVTADGYYYCPHHPNAVISEYRADCNCRKPNPGLILKAISDFAEIGIEFDLEGSFTVGNKISDVLAGVNAGTGNNILIGCDDTDTDGIASAHYESLYEFSKNLKQVL